MTTIAIHSLAELHQGDWRNPAAMRRLYDETLLAVCLQALANREEPRLFLVLNQEQDDFWWKKVRERWMPSARAKLIMGPEELLGEFRGCCRGAVVWDERVPATSNIAATIAGAEDLLAIRYDESPDSLYQRLAGQKELLPIRRRLIAEDGGPMFRGAGTIAGTNLPSTGSAKNDAYRWLIEQYIVPHKINPRVMGYCIDGFWLQCGHAGWPVNHTLTNLDYIIANRGVAWDLNVWEDETAVDDSCQQAGTDLKTLKLLMHACHEQLDGNEMIHVCGFTPWRYKYTNVSENGWNAGGKHGGVATEWKTTEVLSCFDAYLDADALDYASMVNASFYQHYQLPEFVPQQPAPMEEDMKARGHLDEQGEVVPRNYYAHYVGDYDAAAWLYWVMPEKWNDPARGAVPLTWAFNPNLARRFPFGMHWLRETAAENDCFVTGDSGAGYVNPFHLSEPREYSGLPNGWSRWEAQCREWMSRLDLDVVGFVLDGNTPNMLPEGWNAYARFAPGGIVLHRTQCKPQGVHNGMPYLTMAGDLSRDAKAAAQAIVSKARPSEPAFNVYRSVLMNPSWYTEVEQLREEIDGTQTTLVDLRTLLWLVRRHEERRARSTRTNSNKSELKASPEGNDGLYAVFHPEGRFRITHMGEGACWLIPKAAGANFLFLRLDAELSGMKCRAAEVMVTFLDRGAGTLGVESVDARGHFVSHGAEVKKRGTDEWVTEILPAPLFLSPGAQPLFRIRNAGDDLIIREVKLRLKS